MSVNLKDGWPDGDLWFSQVAYTDPSNTLIRKAELGGTQWNNSAFVQAATNVEQMTKGGLFADGSLSLDFNGAIALFGTGRAAMMYPVGNFDTPLIDKADGNKFAYKLFPFPPLKAGGTWRRRAVQAIIFSIPAKSANPQAAIDFIRLTVDAAGFTDLVKNSYIPSAPANISANHDAHYKEMVGFRRPRRPGRSSFRPSTPSS